MPNADTSPRQGSAPEVITPVHPDLAHLDRIAALLDSQFGIPGTSIRFGWDALLGLVPGLGDAVTIAPAAYLFYKGYRMGARKRTLARMGLNTAIDLVVGAVPLLGDLFDVAFKANLRNVALLRADLKARLGED